MKPTHCNGLCETAAGCCCPGDDSIHQHDDDALRAAVEDAKRRVRQRSALSWRQGLATGLWLGTMLGGFVGAVLVIVIGSAPV